MIRRTYLAIATAALGVAAVPASAATYTGTLYGTVTSGSADYYNYATYEGSTVDLAGTPVTITFTADVTNNYTDPDFNFYPRYVNSSVAVVIDAPRPFSYYGSSQTNDLGSRTGTTDYIGDATAAHFSIDGFLGDPDFGQSVDLLFSGATSVPGPVGGSGHTSGYFYTQTGTNDSFDFGFTIDSGFVSAAPAPEPATWMLTIAGLGAVGGMLRRQRRSARSLAARA